MDNRRGRWPTSGTILSPLSISLAYCVLSIGWILFSDRFTEFIPDRSVAQQVQSIKGVSFVLATTVLMFALISRYRRRILKAAAERAAERERRAGIDRLLDALRPVDTPEGTMRAITEALAQLPDVKFAAYLLADRGRFTAMSVEPPLAASWRFARSVAVSLESGDDPPSEHAALTPVLHEGEVIGMLVATTRHPVPPDEHAEGMTQIARASGAWLGPVVTATRNRERRRADLMRTASDLFAVFQPIVDLETGRPVGYESLTRFQDGVSPAARFAEAVALGIGPDLEELAIRRALSDASGFPADSWLAINVSASLLLEEGRLGRLLVGVNRLIVVELTEQEAIVDYEAIRHAIDGLGPNVSLAIDDIGEAFSGLRHLVELRPAFGKLDLALVRDIDADPPRQALVAALHHYMIQTGAQLIAEGVESDAERQMLRSLGIRLAQGFLFGRPSPFGQLDSVDSDAGNLAPVVVSDAPDEHRFADEPTAAPKPPTERRSVPTGIRLAEWTAMHTPHALSIWIVEPNAELRGMLHEVASIEADILAEDDFRHRIERGRRPDALMIDGSTLLRLDGERAALDGVLRTLVVTGRPASELPPSLLERPSVRFLRKPFTIEAIERGMAWLAGGSDDSWADPTAPADPTSEAIPTGW